VPLPAGRAFVIQLRAQPRGADPFVDRAEHNAAGRRHGSPASTTCWPSSGRSWCPTRTPGAASRRSQGTCLIRAKFDSVLSP
jgi:hypothetical protein